MDATSCQQFSQVQPSMCDESRKTVEVHLLELTDYAHEEIYAKIDKIVHPKLPLRNMYRVSAALCPSCSATLRCITRASS